MTAEPSRTLVEIARDDAELARHLADWDALARDAVEPNVFFETGPLRAPSGSSSESRRGDGHQGVVALKLLPSTENSSTISFSTS
jgi:hypothetical protein